MRWIVRYFSRRSIRTNLLLSVGLLILMPLCVSLVALGIYLRENTIRNTISTNQMLTVQVADAIDNTIYEVNYVTSMLMVDSSMLENMRNVNEREEYTNYRARRDISQRIVETESSILNAVEGKIVILSANGYLLASNNLGKSPTDFEGEEWYNEVLRNGRSTTWNRQIEGIFQVALYPEPGRDRFALYCGRAIQGYNGEFLGMICIRLSGGRIWKNYVDMLQTNGVPSEGKGFYILDEKRQIQAVNNQQDAMLADSAFDALSIWDCGAGEIRQGMLDRSVYIATRRSNSPNLYIFVEEQDSFFHDSALITKNIVAIIVLIAVLTISMLIVLSKAISNPLRRFITSVRQSENGLVEIKEEGAFFREMKELVASYNDAGYRIIGLIERVKQESSLRERAHYEVLISQISPHFIFNTVNTVKWMVKENHSRETVLRALESLGEILSSVYSNQSDMTTIGSEIKLLQAYVTIMKIRFEYPFLYSLLIPVELYEYEIPIFTLQPLVENAILHGIRPQGQGQIILSATETADTITISVYNSGESPDAEWIREIFRDHPNRKNKLTGIGLYNINARLQILYGEQYGLSVDHARVTGFEINVNIPKRRVEESND